MKKCLLGILAVMLLTGGAFAQTVGVYFDQYGTSANGLVDIQYNPIQGTYNPAIFDMHVVAFMEGAVGGASYSMDFDPLVTVLAETFDEGINIGSAFDGCGVEFGLGFPQSGYFGSPVHLATITCLIMGPVAGVNMAVTPHCNYGDVIIANGTGELFTGTGLTAVIEDVNVIPNESESWGAVKNLYR